MSKAFSLTLAIAGGLLLAGCGFTEYGDAARDLISVKGAEAADKALAGSEWHLCNASTVGAVKRRYGASQDKANAYNTLCDRSDEADVIQATPADAVN